MVLDVPGHEILYILFINILKYFFPQVLLVIKITLQINNLKKNGNLNFREF